MNELKVAYACLIVLGGLIHSGCSRGVEDAYLRTLDVPEVLISPCDSINLEHYHLFDARKILKHGDWFILSSASGEWNLTFLNPYTGESFNALRRGRGPGEVLRGSSLQLYRGMAIYADYAGAKCLSIDIGATVESKMAVLDTVGKFSDKGPRPLYLCKCGDGFISGNSFKPDSWYSYYDANGKILSEVPAINFDEIKGADNDFMASLALSSKYAANPDGTKVCVANVASGAISFASVDRDFITECKRLELVAPKVVVKNSRTVSSHDEISFFHDIEADVNGVYLLYSGNTLQSDIPVNECRHVVHYSWDGNEDKHYVLSHTVTSIFREGDKLYCTSSYPSSRMYVYGLE